jgi:hypothetical protein
LSEDNINNIKGSSVKKIKYIIYASLIISIAIVGLYIYPYDVHTKKADLIIFSYDRPLQLYALLESLDMYVTGLGKVQVIYRTSDEHYEAAYAEVKKCFGQAHFMAQKNPPHDFKSLTIQAFTQSPHAYILFAVDDIVVKDAINLDECITALEKAGGYGFFLRLGTNLIECYSENRKQSLPVLTDLGSFICGWQFGHGDADWRYPHTVDMTLYRKKDIEYYVRSLHYHNPNLFEGNWAAVAGSIMYKTGLCYQKTKIVNLPLNRVQQIWNNRAMNSFSAAELLTIFNNGMKMDVKPLYQVCNKAAHMEFTPQFIQR